MEHISGARELLELDVNRKVNKLNRDLLNFLDSIRNRQKASTQKVQEILPDEYSNLAMLINYMDDNDFSALRKMILDQTNDFKRDLSSDLDKYTIRLNLIQGMENGKGN